MTITGHGLVEEGVSERLESIRKTLSRRDAALLLVLGPVVLMLLLFGFGFFFAVQPARSDQVQVAQFYRKQADQSEGERCQSAKLNETIPADDGDRGDDGRENAEQQQMSLCLARLNLRESIVANEIAAEYNRISADAAGWARLGGDLVAVLSIVSVLGVVVAVLAASDQRRSLDLQYRSLAASMRSSRAYIQIVQDEAALGLVLIRNQGGSPAVIEAVRYFNPSVAVADIDVSVVTWIEHHVRGDIIEAMGNRIATLPLLNSRECPAGLVVGVQYTDIHGERWCSWRECVFDEESGSIRLGVAGEYPCA